MSRMCGSALSGGTTAFLFSCAICKYTNDSASELLNMQRQTFRSLPLCQSESLSLSVTPARAVLCPKLLINVQKLLGKIEKQTATK